MFNSTWMERASRSLVVAVGVGVLAGCGDEAAPSIAPLPDKMLGTWSRHEKNRRTIKVTIGATGIAANFEDRGRSIEFTTLSCSSPTLCQWSGKDDLYPYSGTLSLKTDRILTLQTAGLETDSENFNGDFASEAEIPLPAPDPISERWKPTIDKLQGVWQVSDAVVPATNPRS
ncbi:MAG: hypothetical protein FJ102_24850, partial [Deltaproteobacteria bacterium]|nr:hypothetical protein [Deltaproteobacteria bacterium]